jgi:3-hydroxyacyl-CoA dehydrogenase
MQIDANTEAINAPEARAIKSVAVVGAGLMGRGIATALINAGMKVELIDADAKVLEKAVAAIKETLQRDVAKGRLTPEAASERFALVSPGLTMASAAQVDLVIEAVFENMDVKRRVFLDLDQAVKASAILATNTSSLDVNAIASATTRPDRVVGLHFFSPASVMKLVEVVRGDKTSGETLASAMAFVKVVGKVGVVAGVCDGFIGNRMFEEYLRQAYFLLEVGALPQQVDAAMEAFGMAMGPFKVMDLAGQDIGWAIRKRRAMEHPDRPYSKIPDLICELGRYGLKTGAGFYLYPDGRRPQVDPFIDALISDYSKSIGARRRDIGDGEIVDRCIFALVNEGAKILAEGIASRSRDIDTVYVLGYGFPEAKGGPMSFADRCGLANVLKKIAAFQSQANGWAWSPPPLLIELAQRGASFGSRDG